MTDPQTIPATLAAIKMARAVFVTPRFGVCEKMVRISKQDARWMLAKMDPSSTPQSCEMYTGRFGYWIEAGEFHLG